MRKVHAEQVGNLFVLSTSFILHCSTQTIVLQQTAFPPALLCPAHPCCSPSPGETHSFSLQGPGASTGMQSSSSPLLYGANAGFATTCLQGAAFGRLADAWANSSPLS